jgi:hypothetical protein
MAGGAYASALKADCEDIDEDEVGETAPEVAGIVQQSGQTASHRSDSCGLFSLRKSEKVKRAMPDDAFENPHAELDEWVAGQGFAIESYMGGRDAVRRSLEAHSGAAGMLPTKEKLTLRDKFDPEGLLFRSGAHKPLLVYVGSLSRRSPEALNRCQSGIRAHGTGRGSCRHKVAALGKGDENEEMGKGGSTHGCGGKGRGKIYEEKGKRYEGKGTISEGTGKSYGWQGKGYEGKGKISEEKGKSYEWKGKSYEGKGKHGVEKGKNRGSHGAKGEQQQWTSGGWGTYEAAAPTVVGIGAGMAGTGAGTARAEAGFLEGSRAYEAP